MTNRSTEPNYCGLSFLKEYDDWYLLRASLMLQNEHQEIPVIEYFLIWKLKHVSGMKRTKTLTLNDADTFPKNNCVFNVFNLALFTSKENDKTRILNEFNLTVTIKPESSMSSISPLSMIENFQIGKNYSGCGLFVWIIRHGPYQKRAYSAPCGCNCQLAKRVQKMVSVKWL